MKNPPPNAANGPRRGIVPGTPHQTISWGGPWRPSKPLIDAPSPGCIALPLDEVIGIVFPFADGLPKKDINRLKRKITPCWRETCTRIERSIDFLARHAGGPFPV